MASGQKGIALIILWGPWGPNFPVIKHLITLTNFMSDQSKKLIKFLGGLQGGGGLLKGCYKTKNEIYKTN